MGLQAHRNAAAVCLRYLVGEMCLKDFQNDNGCAIKLYATETNVLSTVERAGESGDPAKRIKDTRNACGDTALTAVKYDSRSLLPSPKSAQMW